LDRAPLDSFSCIEIETIEALPREDPVDRISSVNGSAESEGHLALSPFDIGNGYLE
jgi:hypothetical protein